MDPQGELFDTIIIGGGPAGLSAAIYAVRKNLKVLIITKDIGGQAALSSDIENYLGFSLISGSELAGKFRADLLNFENNGLTVKEGEEVTSLTGLESEFTVITGSGKYRGKTVIIASGRTPKMLGVPGEKEHLGKGVATCATCDGPFYKDKDVVVVGGGNSALDATFSLMKVAKSVTIVSFGEDVEGDEILKENVKKASNVKILGKHQVVEILGDKSVGGVKIKDLQSGQEDVLTVSGVFVEIGWTPAATFDSITKKNTLGEIEVDEFGKTSVEGIYSAGDVNSLWGEQIIIAAGEGAKVALSVAEHIAKTPHQVTSNPHEQ
jgi:NADH-dependent peroxiredoxin subunit F